MEIKYSQTSESICAELSGELDECSAEYVRITLDNLLKNLPSTKTKLILDFSKVSFMDSTGIGVLLGRYNKFSKFDIGMYIKNPTSYVNRIFFFFFIYQIITKV